MTRLISCVAIVLVSIGCGGPTQPSASKNQTATKVEPAANALKLPEILVKADWLLANASNPNLVILDARSAADYEKEHIPGAIHLPSTKTFKKDGEGVERLPPLTEVQDIVGNAGVDMDRTVVIYDNHNYRDAARWFWVLEVHGHKSVGVLNGGLNAWKKAGGKAVSEASKPTPRQFVANVDPNRLANKLIVQRSFDKDDVVILDARSTKEYEGKESKAKRAGHIPNAVNVDFEKNLVRREEVCTMEFDDALKNLYENIAKGKKIITYCNTGNRASVSYLALRVLGHNPAVYDGSWMEWGNDEAMPIRSKIPKKEPVEEKKEEKKE